MQANRMVRSKRFQQPLDLDRFWIHLTVLRAFEAVRQSRTVIVRRSVLSSLRKNRRIPRPAAVGWCGADAGRAVPA